MSTPDRDLEVGRRLLQEELGEELGAELPGQGSATQFDVKLGTYCRHLQMQVCQEQRTVACASCGAKLDPFDVLWEMACKERWQRGLEAEVRQLKGRIEGLKAEERRAKQRLRRARELAEAEEARAKVRAQEALEL